MFVCVCGVCVCGGGGVGRSAYRYINSNLLRNNKFDNFIFN